MQAQQTSPNSPVSGADYSSSQNTVLLIGGEDAFNNAVTGRLLCGFQFRIAGHAMTPLEGLSHLKSEAIDLVLLGSEFRDEEVSLFMLQAQRRGFAGLVLHIASLPCETRLRFNRSRGFTSLTTRQQAILTRVAEGWTNKQIANHLKCSEGSVKADLQVLFKQFGARGRAQLVRMAFEST
jgi:DNA-binding CsgD family transcriptional regulator